MTDKEAVPVTDTAASTGPAGEQWLEETLDQVFLTPRVVDERAFDELSGSLKSLVKDAAGQSRALIATTGEVKLLSDQLREATKELQQRVDTAVRVIPTLDQRVAKAEQVLDVTGKELAAKVTEMREVASRGVAIDRERLAAQVRTETAGILERILQEQAAVLRERMGAAVQEAQAAADLQAAAIFDRVRAAQETLDRTLEASEAKAQAIAERLDALMAESFGRAVESADRAAQRAESAVAVPSAQVLEAVQTLEQTAAKATKAQATIEAAVNEAGLRLGAAIGEADRRAESIGKLAEQRIAQLREQAVEVVEIAASTNVEQLLGTVRDTVEAAEQARTMGVELHSIVAQTSELSRKCGEAEQGFATVLTRTTAAKEELAQALAEASADVDGLTTRLSALKAQYEQLVKGDGEDGVHEQVRQMGAWLGQLLTQGDMIGRGLDRLIKQAGPMVEKLEQPGSH
jgi:hypothetical protein